MESHGEAPPTQGEKGDRGVFGSRLSLGGAGVAVPLTLLPLLALLRIVLPPLLPLLLLLLQLLCMPPKAVCTREAAFSNRGLRDTTKVACTSLSSSALVSQLEDQFCHASAVPL